MSSRLFVQRKPTQRAGNETLRTGGFVKRLGQKPNLLPSKGRPLPSGIRHEMEAALGHSFADVRVHQSELADDLGARAFTRGRDIVFPFGGFRPHERSGRWLLAHELTHVVQQRAGRVARAGSPATVIRQDPGLEREADLAAQRAARSEPGRVPEGPTDTRQSQGCGCPACVGRNLRRVVPPPRSSTIQLCPKCGIKTCDGNPCIRSSKARFIRSEQRRNPGSKKNRMQEKWVSKSGGGTPLYLVSESLGMGSKGLQLQNDPNPTEKGERRKRTHTEPQHMAVQQQGRIELPSGKKRSMRSLTREYATSTNSMCKTGVKGQQGCEVFEPDFTAGGAEFYDLNTYSGGKSAGGFPKRAREFERMKEKHSDVESESSSEDEYDVVKIDPDAMKGKTFKKGDAVKMTAFAYDKYDDEEDSE